MDRCHTAFRQMASHYLQSEPANAHFYNNRWMISFESSFHQKVNLYVRRVSFVTYMNETTHTNLQKTLVARLSTPSCGAHQT